MGTELDLLIQWNDIAALLWIFPLVLNLKYYLQTRIREYLYISLFFLFSILANESTSWEYRDNQFTFQILISLFLIATYFIIQIAIRTKWQSPPTYAKSIAYSYLIFAILFQFIPPTRYIGNWWIGQYFYNPLNVFANVFILYCFITSSVIISQHSKAKISQYIWIIYYLLRTIQESSLYIIIILPDKSFAEWPNGFVEYLNGINLLGAIIILILHVILPEAVLFSHEQVIRVRKMYNFAYVKNNIIFGLGINTINNYLENAMTLIDDPSM